MTISKKIFFCAAVFLVCGRDLFALPLARKGGALVQQRAFSAVYATTNPYNKNILLEANNRGVQIETKDRHVLESCEALFMKNNSILKKIKLSILTAEPDNNGENDRHILENCEALFINNNSIFEKIKQLIQTANPDDNGENVSSFSPATRKSQNPVGKGSRDSARTLAEIIPVNTAYLDTETPYRDEDSMLLSESGRVESSDTIDRSREASVSQADHANEMKYHDISKVPMEMRSTLVNRVMRFAKNAYQTIEQDVIAILDLYTDLINWQKEGITSVLSGRTNTSKSNVYCAVLKHAKSKQATLSIYRDIYERLSERFGRRDGIQNIIYNVIEDMMYEKRNIIKHVKKQSDGYILRQDYIEMAVFGANPLYPVYPSEVETILDLFSTLNKWKKEGITNVLMGRTNTQKSNVYCAVLKHAKSNQSSIAGYRNRYSRLSKSLDGLVIQHLHKVDNVVGSNTNQLVSNSLEDDQVNFQAEQDTFSELPQDSNSLSSQSIFPFQVHPTFSRTVQGNIKQTSGLSSLSSKEKKLSDRLYKLLSKFSKEIIHKALFKAKKNDNNHSVVQKALLGAIDQIKRETKQTKDSPPINIKYFKNLLASRIQGDIKVDARDERSIVKKTARKSSLMKRKLNKKHLYSKKKTK